MLSSPIVNLTEREFWQSSVEPSLELDFCAEDVLDGKTLAGKATISCKRMREFTYTMIGKDPEMSVTLKVDLSGNKEVTIDAEAESVKDSISKMLPSAFVEALGMLYEKMFTLTPPKPAFAGAKAVLRCKIVLKHWPYPYGAIEFCIKAPTVTEITLRQLDDFWEHDRPPARMAEPWLVKMTINPETITTLSYVSRSLEDSVWEEHSDEEMEEILWQAHERARPEIDRYLRRCAALI